MRRKNLDTEQIERRRRKEEKLDSKTNNWKGIISWEWDDTCMQDERERKEAKKIIRKKYMCKQASVLENSTPLKSMSYAC